MSTRSPYLMLIAVLKDSRAERLEESDIVYVFSLLPLLQMANMKKNESTCLIGLRRLSNVKQLSNGRHVFF